MLPNIAWFELRYQLRRPIALVSFLVFALLGFGLGSAIAMNSTFFNNAPLIVAGSLCNLSIVAMFLSITTLGDVALRDAETCSVCDGPTGTRTDVVRMVAVS